MKKHYLAVKARLVSQLPAAVTLNDSALVDTSGGLVRAQYVILFGGGPDSLDDDRLTAPQQSDSDAQYLYRVRSVAVNVEGCLGVAQLVRDALLGFVPTVAGRTCERMKLDDADPEVLPENAVRPPLFYMDQTFLLISRRA